MQPLTCSPLSPPGFAPPAPRSLQARGGSPTPLCHQTYCRASPASVPVPRLHPAPWQGAPLSNTAGTKKPQQLLPITKLIPASPSHTHRAPSPRSTCTSWALIPSLLVVKAQQSQAQPLGNRCGLEPAPVLARSPARGTNPWVPPTVCWHKTPPNKTPCANTASLFRQLGHLLWHPENH